MNAILHHCSLPTGACSFKEEVEIYDGEDELDDEIIEAPIGLLDSITASVRPGIVHRLDKGTTGLLVVAKVRLTLTLNIEKLGVYLY